MHHSSRDGLRLQGLRLPGQGIHSTWKSQAAPAQAPQPTQLGIQSLVPQGCWALIHVLKRSLCLKT